jgi:hypothetical protein
MQQRDHAPSLGLCGGAQQPILTYVDKAGQLCVHEAAVHLLPDARAMPDGGVRGQAEQGLLHVSRAGQYDGWTTRPPSFPSL